MRALYKKVLLWSIMLLSILLFPADSAAETQCNVVILKSWDLPEYNVAIEAFLETLSARGYSCRIRTYNLKGGAEQLGGLKGEIESFHPSFILTVGSRATGIASRTFHDIPIIFSMVLYPVASEFVKSMEKPGGNVTGASIDIPIRQQLRLLEEIVPDLRRVGVLYSPEETLPVIEEAKRVAQSLGLELIAARVNSESDVPDALASLERQQIQALWSVADGRVFTPQSTRYIIEEAVKKQIPFMGPHNGFVHAGALVALTPSYSGNGRQAAEIAIRILRGASPSSIPVSTPQDIQMALNLRVAAHIGLTIPQSIIEQAAQVYE